MDFNTGGPGGVSEGAVEFSLSDPVGSFVATVRGVVLSPVAFFRGIRRSGDFVGPLVFALICSVVAGILAAFVSLLANLVSGNGFGAAVGGFFAALVGAPVAALIGLFVGAGIYHLVVLLLVRPNAGFEGSFRVVAYASVVQLVSWIPILGGLLALYGIVLGVFGMREVHGTTTGRAVAVILLPTAVVLLVGLVFFAAVVAVLLGAR
ncbi:YIP1 family protein [Rubrobacter indicoceani]|uniref:YIP1 family protein n=1 Tax=Rubrobacter indicoceani TaxID=2051957 RepID=UPI000E5A6446|nr:YIP1 family protein [Rubrobacter indicoceani]